MELPKGRGEEEAEIPMRATHLECYRRPERWIQQRPSNLSSLSPSSTSSAELLLHRVLNISLALPKSPRSLVSLHNVAEAKHMLSKAFPARNLYSELALSSAGEVDWTIRSDHKSVTVKPLHRHPHLLSRNPSPCLKHSSKQSKASDRRKMKAVLLKVKQKPKLKALKHDQSSFLLFHQCDVSPQMKQKPRKKAKNKPLSSRKLLWRSSKTSHQIWLTEEKHELRQKLLVRTVLDWQETALISKQQIQNEISATKQLLSLEFCKMFKYHDLLFKHGAERLKALLQKHKAQFACYFEPLKKAFKTWQTKTIELRNVEASEREEKSRKLISFVRKSLMRRRLRKLLESAKQARKWCRKLVDVITFMSAELQQSRRQAALTIQSFRRSYSFRSAVKHYQDFIKCVVRSQALCRMRRARRELLIRKQRRHKEAVGATELQRMVRGHLIRCVVQYYKQKLYIAKRKLLRSNPRKKNQMRRMMMELGAVQVVHRFLCSQLWKRRLRGKLRKNGMCFIWKLKARVIQRYIRKHVLCGEMTNSNR